MKNITDSIEKLIALYSELCDTLNSNFTLHNRDIESIFDSSYYFKSIDQVEDKTLSFNKSTNIIEDLLKNIEEFKTNENWSLTEEELKLAEIFKSLVESKNKIFSVSQSVHINKSTFIESINRIIESKNATLDLKGREKDASNQRLDLLKRNIFGLFEVLIRVEQHCSELDKYNYNFIQEIDIDEDVTVVIEIENRESIKSKIVEGVIVTNTNISLYQILIQLATNRIRIKNFPDNSTDNLRKKINTQLKSVLEYFDKPIEYLKYSEESNSKNNSPGFNSEKYLETILKKGNSKIIFIDQPEDNLGNKFITENLIDLIRDLKFQKQIFLVTHNPSIVVYGDAENIIMCSNEANQIEYQQFVLENKDHQKEICSVLDGGQYIFEQRARKYNIKKVIQS